MKATTIGTMFQPRSKIPGLVFMAVSFDLDASGDVSNVDGDGVTGVTHDDTGKYTVSLADSFYGITGVTVTFDKDTTDGLHHHLANTPQADVKSDTPHFHLWFSTDAPALANPVSCTVLLEMRLKMSNL